jgi:hypothetical protein
MQREALFDRWWAAATEAAAAMGEEIAASGISFDAALARLKAGRPYSRRVPTGIVRSSRRERDVEFFYAVNVPADYDPARGYPVRIHLHGGVTVPEGNQPRGSGDIGALAGGEPHIYVLPSGWVEAPWWTDFQVRNLREILRTVKRTLPAGEDFDQALTRCRPSNPIALSVLRGGAQVELKGVYEPVKVGDGSLRLFDRRNPSGRLDVAKTGNTVNVMTSGVDAFMLLLSPDAFDFMKPIAVVVNGRPAVEKKLEPSVRTLMKWAALDDDRTMLFGAELPIAVD